MTPLAGHRVAALGGMAERPLARFLASLGAEIGGPVAGASFVIDDLGLAALADLGVVCSRRGDPCLGDVVRRGRPARALARRRAGRVGNGGRAAGDRRARPAAGQGGARRLHLPRRHGGCRRCDGGALFARKQRPRAACRRLGPAGRLQPQRQRHPRLAVRSPQTRPRRRRTGVWPRDGPRDLAAGRRLVLPFADDRTAWGARQPGAVGLDRRRRHGQPAARHRLAEV